MGVVEEMVDLVGDDEQVVRRRQLDKLPPPVAGQGDAGRVLKGRNCVEEGRSLSCEDLRQRVDDESVLVRGRGHDAQTVVFENAQGQEIGGLFDKDGVAAAGEERTDEVQGLGCACGDDNALGVDGLRVVRTQEIGQTKAEIAVALFAAVVEQVRVALRESMLRGLSHEVERKQVKIRLADAEVDHAGRQPDLCGSDGRISRPGLVAGETQHSDSAQSTKLQVGFIVIASVSIGDGEVIERMTEKLQ